MNTFANELRASTAAGGIARIMNPVSRFGPRIMLAPNADGTATPEETAAALEAATAAAAAKVIADKAIADKAIADAAAAETAEAARIAAEANMTAAEKLAAENIREIMDKKAKLKAEKARADALEAELKKFEGIDIAAVTKLLADKAAAETEALEKAGNFEAVKKQMVEAQKIETARLQAIIDANAAEKTLAAQQIDQLTIGADFANSKFIAEGTMLTPTKARVIYGAHFDMVDGKSVAFDKPKGVAGRQPYADASGEPLSFDAAMKKIIEADPEKDHILVTKQKPGAGGKTTDVEVKPGKRSESDGPYGVGRIAAGLQLTNK